MELERKIEEALVKELKSCRQIGARTVGMKQLYGPQICTYKY
jgi:hypothetical protein